MGGLFERSRDIRLAGCVTTASRQAVWTRIQRCPLRVFLKNLLVGDPPYDWDLAFGGPVPESPAVGATAVRVVCVRLPRTVGGGSSVLVLH